MKTWKSDAYLIITSYSLTSKWRVVEYLPNLDQLLKKTIQRRLIYTSKGKSTPANLFCVDRALFKQLLWDEKRIRLLETRRSLKLTIGEGKNAWLRDWNRSKRSQTILLAFLTVLCVPVNAVAITTIPALRLQRLPLRVSPVPLLCFLISDRVWPIPSRCDTESLRFLILVTHVLLLSSKSGSSPPCRVKGLLLGHIASAGKG